MRIYDLLFLIFLAIFQAPYSVDKSVREKILLFVVFGIEE